MKITHIALWTQNLEGMKYFYVNYLKGKAGNLYINRQNKFESYFISFGKSATIEIMRRDDITKRREEELIGYAHIAFTVGSINEVKELTENLRKQGVPVLSEPRFTGDGYFESVVADPDGNKVELMANCITKPKTRDGAKLNGRPPNPEPRKQ